MLSNARMSISTVQVKPLLTACLFFTSLRFLSYSWFVLFLSAPVLCMTLVGIAHTRQVGWTVFSLLSSMATKRKEIAVWDRERGDSGDARYFKLKASDQKGQSIEVVKTNGQLKSIDAVVARSFAFFPLHFICFVWRASYLSYRTCYGDCRNVKLKFELSSRL